ncbi:MAG TPA: hypothetical protein PK228_16740, partial [Saprospiraceae bacterium]|nr:hypothetical protein [Saprospiraceae bacterium]
AEREKVNKRGKKARKAGFDFFMTGFLMHKNIKILPEGKFFQLLYTQIPGRQSDSQSVGI